MSGSASKYSRRSPAFARALHHASAPSRPASRGCAAEMPGGSPARRRRAASPSDRGTVHMPPITRLKPRTPSGRRPRPAHRVIQLFSAPSFLRVAMSGSVSAAGAFGHRRLVVSASDQEHLRPPWARMSRVGLLRTGAIPPGPPPHPPPPPPPKGTEGEDQKKPPPKRGEREKPSPALSTLLFSLNSSPQYFSVLLSSPLSGPFTFSFYPPSHSLPLPSDLSSALCSGSSDLHYALALLLPILPSLQDS